MWHLLIIAGLWMFRGKVGAALAPLTQKLGLYLPATTPQKNAFYGHLLMLLGGVIFALPIEFVGFGWLKRLGYLLSLWSVIVTSGMNIKVNYGDQFPGMPQMSGFSIAAIKQTASQMMPAMQPFLEKALLSVDFHFMFFALIFVVANPSLFAVLILARRSFWAVCSYWVKTPEAQGRLWQLAKPLWEKLKAKEAEVLQQSALAEIMLGFWLTVSLFLPSRQILTCILYWNYLKIRYQAAVAGKSKHHIQAWDQIGNSTQPVLKMVPFLQKPLDMAKGWFKPQYQVR